MSKLPQDGQTYIVMVGGNNESDIGLNSFMIVEDGKALMIDEGVMRLPRGKYGVESLTTDPQAICNELGVRLVGRVITHGHDDHIGGIGTLNRCGMIEGPIVARPMSVAYIKQDCVDANWTEDLLPEFIVPEFKKPVDLDGFEIEFCAVSHSIADAASVRITTPNGRKIVIGADQKLDDGLIPVETTDHDTLARWGDEGVDLLTWESTYGAAPDALPISEEQTREDLIAQISRFDDRRVLVPILSRNLPRINSIFHAAAETGRTVAFFGKSLVLSKAAMESTSYRMAAGIPNGVEYMSFADAEKKRIPSEKLLVIMTGGLGDQGALPNAVANFGSGKGFKLNESVDAIVMGQSPIPNTLDGYNAMLEKARDILGKGYVVAPGENLRLASGHWKKPDLPRLVDPLKPHQILTTHGGMHQLYGTAEMLTELGHNVMTAPNATIFQLGDNGELRQLEQKLETGWLGLHGGAPKSPDEVTLFFREGKLVRGVTEEGLTNGDFPPPSELDVKARTERIQDYRAGRDGNPRETIKPSERKAQKKERRRQKRDKKAQNQRRKGMRMGGNH